MVACSNIRGLALTKDFPSRHVNPLKISNDKMFQIDESWANIWIACPT